MGSTRAALNLFRARAHARATTGQIIIITARVIYLHQRSCRRNQRSFEETDDRKKKKTLDRRTPQCAGRKSPSMRSSAVEPFARRARARWRRRNGVGDVINRRRNAAAVVAAAGRTRPASRERSFPLSSVPRPLEKEKEGGSERERESAARRMR